jgi:hypothetical protein
MKLWIKPFSFSSKHTKRFVKRPYFHQGENTMPTKAESIKAGKDRKKQTKVSKQPHPFGPPEARAKDYELPGLNPTLFATSKSVTHLPQNLQDVFAEVSKHADGISLKSLRVGKMSTKYRSWMVRQLAKHEFLRVKAEEKPEPKPVREKKAVAK